jgi:uncharacterized protein involved in response to NO
VPGDRDEGAAQQLPFDTVRKTIAVHLAARVQEKAMRQYVAVLAGQADIRGVALPSAYLATVIASGACWSAAFALYTVRYWPVLTRPRIDGKPG